jgi:hypothetical protein
MRFKRERRPRVRKVTTCQYVNPVGYVTAKCGNEPIVALRSVSGDKSDYLQTARRRFL